MVEKWQGRGGRHNDSYITVGFREFVNVDVSASSVTERDCVNGVTSDINLVRFCSQATLKFGYKRRVEEACAKFKIVSPKWSSLYPICYLNGTVM